MPFKSFVSGAIIGVTSFFFVWFLLDEYSTDDSDQKSLKEVNHVSVKNGVKQRNSDYSFWDDFRAWAGDGPYGNDEQLLDDNLGSWVKYVSYVLDDEETAMHVRVSFEELYEEYDELRREYLACIRILNVFDSKGFLRNMYLLQVKLYAENNVESKRRFLSFSDNPGEMELYELLADLGILKMEVASLNTLMSKVQLEHGIEFPDLDVTEQSESRKIVEEMKKRAGNMKVDPDELL